MFCDSLTALLASGKLFPWRRKEEEKNILKSYKVFKAATGLFCAELKAGNPWRAHDLTYPVLPVSVTNQKTGFPSFSVFGEPNNLIGKPYCVRNFHGAIFNFKIKATQLQRFFGDDRPDKQ